MDYGEALLFEPTARDLKLDYPELAEVEEFKVLSQRELKFVWYVGNRTSPIAGKGKKERLKAASVMAWGDYHAKKQKVQDIAKGKLEPKMVAAIEKMSSYNPSVRLKAKFMQEYIFDKMQNIIIVSSEELEEMDADERKKYTDLALKVSSDLTSLVDRMERGYGVKVKETSDAKKKNEILTTVSNVIDKIN